MGEHKILITGATGFLGAAIVNRLANDYELMATVRSSSKIWRCADLYQKVRWANINNDTFEDDVINFSPDIILHSAWSGINSKDRADWKLQTKNFELLGILLAVAQKTAVKKIIVLGSQAEYGNINGKTNEQYPVNPIDAYAACKAASQKLIQTFCDKNLIAWYWLRVFSVFGPKEDSNWFIPSLIINQLNNFEIDLTLCEQRYDYLYIADFAEMIFKVITTPNKPSGIYNISSGKATSLLTIANTIEAIVGNHAKMNFGAIPYRDNQSMHIEGDNSKYNSIFGAINTTSLDLALGITVSYYKTQKINN